MKGYVQRRQGKQEEALRNLERAVELDPRNALTLQQMALSYELVRRYPEAKLVWDRVLALEPNDMESKTARALVEFQLERRYPAPASVNRLYSGRQDFRSAARLALTFGSSCALAERDTAAAQNALIALGGNSAKGWHRAV